MDGRPKRKEKVTFKRYVCGPEGKNGKKRLRLKCMCVDRKEKTERKRLNIKTFSILRFKALLLFNHCQNEVKI